MRINMLMLSYTCIKSRAPPTKCCHTQLNGSLSIKAFKKSPTDMPTGHLIRPTFIETILIVSKWQLKKKHCNWWPRLHHQLCQKENKFVVFRKFQYILIYILYEWNFRNWVCAKNGGEHLKYLHLFMGLKRWLSGTECFLLFRGFELGAKII